MAPDLRVLVDGDPSEIYHPGDHVRGKVVLYVEEQEQIKGLKLSFAGVCITKTTRSLYVAGNDNHISNSPRKEYRERSYLFKREQLLIPESKVRENRHTFPFTFVFPESTEAKHSRWTHGSKFNKGPHALPPSFHIKTDSPGGTAIVTYFVQAKLFRGNSKDVQRATYSLVFQQPPPGAVTEPKLASMVLYNQALKPVGPEIETRTVMDKVIRKISHRSSTQQTSPRIVPTLHFPERVAPGQLIPLSFTLRNTRPCKTCEDVPCVMDSLTLVLSTITTCICGHLMTQPQDTVVKDVKCVSRQAMNIPLSFDLPTKLTTSLRLVDDAQSVPTFTTYTITRHYKLTATIGVKIGNQMFTIRSMTPLRILPRDERILAGLRAGTACDVDGVPVDPLPLYEPRHEPEGELAPDYEELMHTSVSIGSEDISALESAHDDQSSVSSH